MSKVIKFFSTGEYFKEKLPIQKRSNRQAEAVIYFAIFTMTIPQIILLGGSSKNI